MSIHLDVVHRHTNGTRVREEAEGIRLALAVTDDEVVTGRAGFLGRWGSKVERFRLRDLVALRVVPNPSASLLMLEFGGSPQRTLTVMYGPQAQGDFDRIVGLLQGCVAQRPTGGQR